MGQAVMIDGFATQYPRARLSKWRSAKPSLPVRHCLECGDALPPAAATGRPRLTCSEPCRRAFDKRQRKIRSRLESIQLWRAELGQGRYRRAEIRLHIRELRAELYVLSHPRPPTS